MSRSRRTQILLLLALAACVGLIINQFVGAGNDLAPPTPIAPSNASPVVLHPATTQSAIRPATSRGGFRLPDEYAVLQSRNPFSAGGAGRGRGGASGPEASFVFKGAIDAGQTMTAFIEDLTSKQVLELRPGDPVARGTIKSVDLDSLLYAGADNPRRIEIGQNLLGIVVPPTPPATNPSVPATRGGALAIPNPAARGARAGATMVLPPGVVITPAGPGGPAAPPGPPADAPPPPDSQ